MQKKYGEKMVGICFIQLHLSLKQLAHRKTPHFI